MSATNLASVKGRRQDGTPTVVAQRQAWKARYVSKRRRDWPRDLAVLCAAIPAPPKTACDYAGNVGHVGGGARSGVIVAAWDMFLFDNLPPEVRACLRELPLDLPAYRVMQTALEQGWSPSEACLRLRLAVDRIVRAP